MERSQCSEDRCPWGKVLFTISHGLESGEESPQKPTSDGFNQIRGQVREVAQGLMSDLVPVAVGAAQQMRLIDAALINASVVVGYMDLAPDLRDIA